MIETKLILIEGPPGSGKSTTARQLADEISRRGQPCDCYLEWSPDNPIAIGDEEQLGQVVATSIRRDAEVLQQWQALAQARQAAARITVMESRFWQTSVMLMYAAGASEDAVLTSNQRVIEAIRGLKPVLVYFAIDDNTAFAMRTIQLKNDEWQRAGLVISWLQYVLAAFEPQQWFAARNLTGLAGMHAFMEEWALVTERLYTNLPFPKLKIRNPYLDRTAAMDQIHSFLELK